MSPLLKSGYNTGRVTRKWALSEFYPRDAKGMAYWGISRSTARPALAVALRYGLAVASVATALGTTLILRNYNSPPRFISHFTLIAIAVTFWYAGTGPGLLAFALSCLGVSLLARNHFLLPGFPLESFLIVYAVFSLLMSWFSASRRRAEQLLIEARDNLELRVAERTGELVRANDKLQDAQAELRSREAYLAEAQRLSHTGSWVWGVVGRDPLHLSEEWYRIYGFDPEGGMPVWEEHLQRIHPEDRSKWQETIDRAISEKSDYEVEFRILLPDGTVKYIHSVGHPVLNTSGDLVQFVGSSMDISVSQRAFEEIHALKDQLYQENLALREDIDQASMFEEIVGSSKTLRRVLSQVAKVAPTDSTVLILGETGTGKELIARAIHNRSRRSTCAFVRINCAAVPASLVASELFGHEKGAFTGAVQRRLGRFELANGGTIFLDEVGELPLETQITLLRVLQEREFERIGGSQAISVDVRVLAATNRDLNDAITAGTFRRDLFYRLNVFPIQIPALRERLDDIPILVEYLIERYAKKAGKRIKTIRKNTLELFQAYDWPGNIRELQNVVERAVVLCDGDTFSIDETWLKRELPRGSPPLSMPEGALGRLDADRERRIIEAALAETGGRIAGPSGAAAKLGIPRQTLDSKISNLGINKNRFKSA
jgi:PAS domain S-box-containing protein